MPEDQAIPFTELASADLLVDQLYEGGSSGNISDDPLARLLPVGNQGGFRYSGSPSKGITRLVALFSTTDDVDWPDFLDPQTGVFTYYGDNRRPGRELHDTQRGGNLLLRDTFERSQGTAEERQLIPPFLLFEKAAPGRRVIFRGLLAPGAATLSTDDELQAIWRTTKGRRFQNYRARFTVLDHAHITRAWLDDALRGHAADSPHCPPVWTAWLKSRMYTSLQAPLTSVVRSKQAQQPEDATGRAILATIHQHFAGRPHDFEACAVEIWRLIAPATGRCDTTQPSRDGGRDAIGSYVLGPRADPIEIDFALEAKCYAPTTVVGVRDVARLVSRLRHRQFGVFVTTSQFDRQAYTEVRTDGHPIALVCGRDVVDALRSAGFADVPAVKRWLDLLGS